MARVKGGFTTRRRRKKVLKLAKGYYGSKHTLYKTAHEQVMKSLVYAYRDRKALKREMRQLWIARINAAARMNDLSYSKLMHGLKIAGIEINRKMLSEIAIHDSKGFEAICNQAKKALENPKAVAKTEVKPAKVEKTEVKVAKEVKVEKEAKKEVKEVKAEPKADLESLTVAELKEMAKAKGITGISAMKKADLIAALK